MAELGAVVKDEKVEFEGLFNISEVCKIVKDWMGDKGYVPVESKAAESISKTGKNIEVVYEPYKKFTDYAKSKVRIIVVGKDLTEVEVKKVKKKLNKGKLEITFDAWLETDYEHKWETKPVFYVIRTIFEKYVYTPFLSGFKKQITEDVNTLKDNLKAYLNLYKY